MVKCFVLGNEMLGHLEHEECEETCICNRGRCSGKEIKELMCPFG